MAVSKRAPSVPDNHEELLGELERRMGRTHAHLRLGLERDHEAWVFGQGRALFNIENWYSLHALMRTAFRVSGFYGRGQRNAARVAVKENTITSQRLPSHFDGFTILQLSDLHVETSGEALESAASAIDTLAYDICVLTGDFRSLTYGPHEAAMEGLEKLLRHIQKPTYAVLGNHDTILMVPELERMGIRVLLNEADAIPRGTSGEQIFLAGVDDAHYFRADNLEKAASSHSRGFVLRAAVAHSRTLPPSRQRWVRRHAERAHARWAGLPARRGRLEVQCRDSAAIGSGSVAA